MCSYCFCCCVHEWKKKNKIKEILQIVVKQQHNSNSTGDYSSQPSASWIVSNNIIHLQHEFSKQVSLFGVMSLPPYYPRFNHFSSFFCLRLENPFLFCLLVEKLKTTSSFVSLWSLQFVTCFPFSVRRGLWEKGGRYASMIFILSSSWRSMRTFFLNFTPTPICGF